MTGTDRPGWIDTDLLHADLRAGEDELVIELKGDLDVSNADMLCQRLNDENPWAQTVVLDLAGLGFCDSSGLRTFLRCAKSALEAGGRLILREPSEVVRRSIEVAGLDGHFEIEIGGVGPGRGQGRDRPGGD